MATQQYGYGPNVWGTAKGAGVQQFAKLAQPGAVAPQFKENKYKALAAKAIGEMAYGAMMNSEAKKKQQQEKAKKQKLIKETNMIYGDSFEALRGMGTQFDTNDSTVFGNTIASTQSDSQPADATVSYSNITDDRTDYKLDTTKLPTPTGLNSLGKPFIEGGSWQWKPLEQEEFNKRYAAGEIDVSKKYGEWYYRNPSEKKNKFSE